jgi:AcrR family transcriptional regulator
LPQRSQVVLEPRKSPVQARSAASVDAILEATIQVLLSVGKERLTTTKVAMRAGVSVGTLYQYFPNKSALLQAVLRRHMDGVTRAVELVCKEQQGQTLREMMTALMSAFLAAKMKEVKTSVALYSVSSDVDGAKIVQQTGVRTNKAIVRMLETRVSRSQLIRSLWLPCSKGRWLGSAGGCWSLVLQRGSSTA